MNEDRFYELFHTEKPKERKCIRCNRTIFGKNRMCGECQNYVSKQSVRAGDITII